MDQQIKKQGYVLESFPNGVFKVKLEKGKDVLAYVSGKMRSSNIKVLIGDKVDLIVSSCGERGRIVYRLKK